MQVSEKLIERLASARFAAVLTGAGVSAESGISTFRDPDGLWTKFNPAELASVNGFMSNPELVWSWYQYRRGIIHSTEPNPGHIAIAEMQNMFGKFTLITQNVDRLHQQAGSRDVIELHGNIIDNHCLNCKKPFEGETDLPDKQLPRCPTCGGFIRPSVVWFGEMLPQKALQDAEIAAQTCDIFFSIGTSGEVYPAANLPLIAGRAGAYTVEVNPNRTSLSHYFDERLEAPSGIAMPAVLEALKKYKG
ncbi:MAG: NAD-dependent protein deacylase [Bacteroidota bacterium]|nr:NAD-dependent protein deacylase [Bacteroidota bacterium]